MKCTIFCVGIIWVRYLQHFSTYVSNYALCIRRDLSQLSTIELLTRRGTCGVVVSTLSGKQKAQVQILASDIVPFRPLGVAGTDQLTKWALEMLSHLKIPKLICVNKIYFLTQIHCWMSGKVL